MGVVEVQLAVSVRERAWSPTVAIFGHLQTSHSRSKITLGSNTYGSAVVHTNMVSRYH